VTVSWTRWMREGHFARYDICSQTYRITII
jgi:hypothetical protein